MRLSLKFVFSKEVIAKRASQLTLALLCLAATACSKNSNIADLLPAVGTNQSNTQVNTGSPIILLPNAQTLSPSAQLPFTASGGKPPYTFSLLIGSGSIDPTSGLYTATSNTGTVIVKVTDTLGSIALATVTISSSGSGPSSTGSLVISPTNKVLALNNSFGFLASGGSPPYTFSIQSGVGVVQALSGAYSATSTGVAVVRVTDAIGTSADASVMINAALSLTATQNIVSVNNSTGLSASGGVAPYFYTLASGSGSVNGSTYTASSTPGGASVQVNDSIGNTSTTFITVNGSLNLSPASKTLAISNTFNFSASGGVSPYLYSILSGGAGGTINSSTGFYTAPNGTGSDTVRVTDGLANSTTSTVTVNSGLTINPASLTLGLNNTRTFTALGGVSPFTFSVASGVGTINAVSGIYNASSTGSAVIRVTDAQGNIANSNVTVTNGLAINVTSSTLSVGNTTSLSASGGVAPYSYSLVGGGGSIAGSSYTAPGASGTATIRVTDNLGSTNDANVTITPALSISPSARSLTTSNTYTFLATGGVGPYVFSIFSGVGTVGASSGIYSSAVTGTGTVRVTDSLNNTSNASVTVTAPLSISPSPKTLTITNTATFSGSGGVVPYTFSILSGGVGSINATSGFYTAPASAGSATVRATDAIGNTSDSAVTVNANLTLAPAAYTMAINNTATFNGLGGVPPYTYTVQSGGGTVNSSGVFTAPASTGTTVIKVTDAAAATSTSTVTINPALSVSPSATTIAINNTANLTASGGVSPYSWSTNFGAVSSTGTFTAPATAGTATVTLSDSLGNTRTATITVNAVLTITPSTVTLAANGVTQTFSASGGAGAYTFSTTIGAINSSTGVLTPPGSSGTGTVTVTDGLGNTRTATVTVNAALVMTPITKTLAVTNTFTLTATGGVAPLTYSVFSGGGTITSSTYTAPGTAGSAVIRVTDAVGNIATCAVTTNAALSISPTSQVLAVNNNKTFTAADGVSPYTFTTTNGAINSSSGFYTAPATSGTSTVTVTDAAGNTVSSAITINPALAISPATKKVLINETFGFSASGGATPYSYSVVAGTGSIIASSGVYTPPALAGTATVRVTDALGNSSNSAVTISTFTTQENYQYVATYSSALNGMTTDSGGSIYAVGYGTDSGGISHWLVKKSTDQGVSFSVVDDFNYSSGKPSVGNFIITNAAGTILFTGGSGADSSGNPHWIVRTSTNGGSSWTTLDDYVYVATRASIARGGVVMANGDLYVTGSGVNGVMDFITRKLPFGGAWSTVDDYAGVGGSNAVGYSIMRDASGNIFSGGYSAWYTSVLIRKSGDSGATWSTVYSIGNGGGCQTCGFYSMLADSSNNVYASGSHGYYAQTGPFFLMKSPDAGSTWPTALDSYNWPSAPNSTANQTSVYSLALDSANNVLEAGIVSDTTPLGHWFLRKANQTLSTTTTIDDFQLVTTQSSTAKAVVVLSNGKIIVGGFAADVGGVNHWIIRTF